MVAGRFDNNIGFIIQARVSSERLPKKVLLPLPFPGGKPLLQHIIDSLLRHTGNVVVATSNQPENDDIEALCNTLDVECFRGSEDDVLSRFVEIQKRHRFDVIFRLTADNPIIDINLLSSFLDKFMKSGDDYWYSKGLPLGMNFEVFKGDSLLRSAQLVESNMEKEHVTVVLRNHPEFSANTYQFDTSKSGFRVTVDEPADYGLLSLVFCYKQTSILEGLDLLKAVDRDFPFLFHINSDVVQKTV